jgi:cytochrome c-type biogenesis protein CcmE
MPRTRTLPVPLVLLLLILVAVGCTKNGGSASGVKTDAGPTCRASGAGDAYALVDRIVEAPDEFLPCREVKAHGYVVAGSIRQQVVEQTSMRTFELESKGRRVRVTHRGPVPDTFKDNAETVVTGKLVRTNTTLELHTRDGADGISAKCPSRYAAPN